MEKNMGDEHASWIPTCSDVFSCQDLLLDAYRFQMHKDFCYHELRKDTDIDGLGGQRPEL